MTQEISFIELDDDEVIAYACKVLEARLEYRLGRDAAFKCPADAKRYAKLRFADRPAEVFAVQFLDNRHRAIALEEMFQGTIDQAAVYPREVVRRALHHNAAAVLFIHNHPSGIAEPSEGDKKITLRLKEALALIDVRVLDHLVVGDEVVSFAERGLL